MTYQEQMRRDKLRKKAAAAYACAMYSRDTQKRSRVVRNWIDINARLERLTDKTTGV